MATTLRIATFNVENLDDPVNPGPRDPSLDERIAVMQPQLKRLRADVLCLQEVHAQKLDQQTLGLPALEKLLAGTGMEDFYLAYARTSEGKLWPQRNLIILSRWPVAESAEYHNQLTPAPLYKRVTEIPEPALAKPVEWERPILWARIALPGGDLHVVNLHLKAKTATGIRGQKTDDIPWRTAAGWAEGFFLSSMKRVGQALETRVLVDSIFDRQQSAMIAVCGDFNGEMDDVPVQAIRGRTEDTENRAHVPYTLFPCELSVPESARFSLIHEGHGCMFDHILASRPLLAYYRGTEIHNETLHDESVAFAYDMYFPESDHAPVVAEFELP